MGPVRLSTGIMQPLYVRALALRSMDHRPEHTLVFAALDSQGYFAAYQSGPYGIAAMRAALSVQLGIPVSNTIIASPHSHAAPDTVGFWGGASTSYLARVYDQTIRAITRPLPISPPRDSALVPPVLRAIRPALATPGKRVRAAAPPGLPIRSFACCAPKAQTAARPSRR